MLILVNGPNSYPSIHAFIKSTLYEIFYGHMPSIHIIYLLKDSNIEVVDALLI